MTFPRISFTLLNRLLIVAFVYMWLSPTVRYILVGAKATHTLYEAFITSLPDQFIFLLLIAGFLKYIELYRNKEIRISKFDKVFIIFWLSNVILGFILAMNLKISILGFRITYLPMVFYFFGRIYGGQSKQVIYNLLNGIFGTVTFFSFIGFIIYFWFPSWDRIISYDSGHEQADYFIVRLNSILWRSPVQYGTMAAMACGYYYFLLLKREGNWLTYVWLGIVSFGLMLSVSRGPIIGFVIGFILLSILFRHWKVLLFSGIIVGSFSMIVSLYSTGNTEELKWVVRSTSETISMDSTNTRVNRWQQTIQHFRVRPWGYGIGKAGAVAFNHLLQSTEPSANVSTDGWLLKLGCETGVYGILSYLIMSIMFLRNSIKTMIKNNRGLLAFGFIIFIMLNAQSIVANVFDFYPHIIIYWIIIGLAENEHLQDTSPLIPIPTMK